MRAEPPATPVERRSNPRRRRLALAGLAVLAAGGATAAILSTSAAATPRIVPNSLVEVNPHSGRPIVVVPLRPASLPGPIAITHTAIWTANYGSDDVSRYDLRTHEVDTRGVTPGQPFDIVFDREGNAWVSNTPADDEPDLRSVVVRLGAGAGGTLAGPLAPSHLDTLSFDLPMGGLEAFGANRVWVIVGSHGPLSRDTHVAVVDTQLETVASVLHLDESATSVAYGYDTAWVGTYGLYSNGKDDSRIEAFRPGQSKPRRIVLEKHGAQWGPLAIGVGDGAVWAITYSSRRLVKINPITLHVERSRDLPAENDGLAVGAGGVWITSNHVLTEIDPRTVKPVRAFELVHGKVGQLCGVAATRTQLWVTSADQTCNTIGS